MKPIVFIFLLAMAIAACNKDQKETDFITDDLRTEAQMVVKNDFDAMEKIDSLKMMDDFLLNPDGIFLMDGYFSTFADLIPLIRNNIKNLSGQSFEGLKDHYLFLDSKTFIYSYSCTNKIYELSGKVITFDPFCGSYTYKKIDGTWRVIHIHESSMNIVIDSSMVKM